LKIHTAEKKGNFYQKGLEISRNKDNPILLISFLKTRTSKTLVYIVNVTLLFTQLTLTQFSTQ